MYETSRLKNSDLTQGNNDLVLMNDVKTQKYYMTKGDDEENILDGVTRP